MLKYLFKIEFPYWFNKQLGLYFYYRNENKNKVVQLSIWEYHQIKDLKGYEDEWFSSWWKHVTLLKWQTK